MGKRITYPMGGAGLYRVGSLLFEDGVATIEGELSNNDRELIALLGCEVEDDDAKEGGSDEEPSPEPQDVASGSIPVSTDSGVAEPSSEAPSSSFPDVAATTPEQAATAPFEVATVASDTDGSAQLASPAPIASGEDEQDEKK